MKNLTIATAQFENASGDKRHNLNIIRRLSAEAAKEGADAIAFHECSITGYTFARRLTRDALLAIAEPIPDGPSIKELQSIARDNKITVLAGLFERDRQDSI